MQLKVHLLKARDTQSKRKAKTMAGHLQELSSMFKVLLRRFKEVNHGQGGSQSQEELRNEVSGEGGSGSGGSGEGHVGSYQKVKVRSFRRRGLYLGS